MPFFLETCARNPQFHWLLLADHPYHHNLPRNVKIFLTSPQEQNRRFQSTCGFAPPNDREPYKLCDWRPAFGLIYKDLLQPFTHWGHCDLDILWGDLSPLAEVLTKGNPDVLSAGPSSTGHCQLYRNVDSVNRLVLQSPVHISGWRHPLNLALDEPSWSWVLARTPGLRWQRLDIASMQNPDTPVLFGATLLEDGKICGFAEPPLSLYWQAGKVLAEFPAKTSSHNRIEFLYLHFMAAKNSPDWSLLSPAELFQESKALFVNRSCVSLGKPSMIRIRSKAAVFSQWRRALKLALHSLLFLLWPFLKLLENAFPRLRFRRLRAAAVLHRHFWLARWHFRQRRLKGTHPC